jgi:hypothetical protein
MEELASEKEAINDVIDVVTSIDMSDGMMERLD